MDFRFNGFFFQVAILILHFENLNCLKLVFLGKKPTKSFPFNKPILNLLVYVGLPFMDFFC